MRMIALAALAAALLPAQSICGRKMTLSGGARVEVACVDWPALAKWFPVPPGTRPQIQVWVRASDGVAVRVIVDGVVKFADLSADANGGKVGMVPFDEFDHETLEVAVLDKREQ